MLIYYNKVPQRPATSVLRAPRQPLFIFSIGFLLRAINKDCIGRLNTHKRALLLFFWILLALTYCWLVAVFIAFFIGLNIFNDTTWYLLLVGW